MELTAIIKKGEKQFVALCPEIDVVSQGFTVEEALDNLKEAVEVYIEEMGLPEEIKRNDMLIAHFEVFPYGETTSAVRV
ncbi:MAG: type II toxin-antitoxin system HicB family antitoxin [Methanosarcinales archaeon]|nr:type II toxin-antitoxin system HicB family antitoxin [Methanosarcinales archaeon]